MSYSAPNENYQVTLQSQYWFRFANYYLLCPHPGLRYNVDQKQKHMPEQQLPKYCKKNILWDPRQAGPDPVHGGRYLARPVYVYTRLCECAYTHVYVCNKILYFFFGSGSNFLHGEAPSHRFAQCHYSTTPHQAVGCCPCPANADSPFGIGKNDLMS